MIARTVNTQSRQRRRRAISLVEIVVSTAIVSMLTVTVMKSLGATLSSKYELAVTNNARSVAEALLLEIIERPYEDLQTPGSIGPETGETTGGTRALFDDVDDYAEWSAGPPVKKDGTPLSNADGWIRTVTIAYVDPDDLTTTVADDRGVKLVTVAVEQNEVSLAKLTTVVTSAWQLPPFE